MVSFQHKGTRLTSLYDIVTPGNFSDWTIDKPSGVGGKDAADAPRVSEVKAQRAFERTAIFNYKKTIRKKISNVCCRVECNTHITARACSGILQSYSTC